MIEASVRVSLVRPRADHAEEIVDEVLFEFESDAEAKSAYDDLIQTFSDGLDLEESDDDEDE